MAFTACDTGVGIDVAKLPDNFRRFVIVEDFLGKELDGRGLGLSAAQQPASLHGGELAAQSEPGQGSTFRLTLPLSPAG